jgi:SPP1 family predicted phage head-tail adaptor
MIARKYTKAISIWQSSDVADGFGGSTVEDSLVYSFWANVETKRANRLSENGQVDNIVQTIFTIRNRYDVSISVKDYFIQYNGLTYNIDSVMNIDLNNIDIVINASQRE